VNAVTYYGDGSNLTGISGSPDGDWIVSGSDMYAAVSGNVGIGLTNPADKFDVDGDINTSSGYKIEGYKVFSIDVGDANTFLGQGAGYSDSLGSYNTYVGQVAGYNIDGYNNTFIGRSSGYSKTAGNWNTFIGNDAGAENLTGDGNVFIGYEAGMNEPGSNKLYVANSRDTSDVLIYGDFSTGKVGLGTLSPAERLHLHQSSGSQGMRISSDASSYQYINMGATNGYSIGCDASDRFFLNREQPLGSGVLRILTVLNDGKIGVGTNSPTDEFHVVGDIYCTGKLTSDGGNDPPYVLYNKESRSAVVERVHAEVPDDKLDGAVLFYNGEESRLEIYFPETGEFRDLVGNLLFTVANR
jgi:hypothetical protein